MQTPSTKKIILFILKIHPLISVIFRYLENDCLQLKAQQITSFCNSILFHLHHQNPRPLLLLHPLPRRRNYTSHPRCTYGSAIQPV